MIIGNGSTLSSLVNREHIVANQQQPFIAPTNVGIIGLNDTAIKIEHNHISSNSRRSLNVPINENMNGLNTRINDYTAAVSLNNTIIENFILIETKPLNQDMYQRSHKINSNHETIAKFEEVVDRSNLKHGGELKEVQVAKLIPDMMEYSKMAGNRIDIVGGWGQARFRFFLKLKTFVGDHTQHYYIQGYSNYLDNNMLMGTVDSENMRLYINSIIETDEVPYPNGIKLQKISKSINVINNGSEITVTEIHNGPSKKLSRPEDIFNSMVNLMDNEGNTTFDFTNAIDQSAKASFKCNNDGISHFTRVVNAAVSEGCLSNSISHSKSSPFANAENIVAESQLTDIPMIKALSSLTKTVPCVSFNLNNLIDLFKERYIDPIIINDNRINATDSVKAMGFNVGIDGRVVDSMLMHETYDASVETAIAYSIHNKICNYMSNMRFGEVTITMSNLNLGDTIEVEALAKPLIEEVNDTEFIRRIEHLKQNVKHVLFNEVSKNNQRPMSVLVNMNWLGKTTIAIDLKTTGGNNLKTYSFPTYADSLFSPVVGDHMTYKLMVQDYSNIMECLK